MSILCCLCLYNTFIFILWWGYIFFISLSPKLFRKNTLTWKMQKKYKTTTFNKTCSYNVKKNYRCLKLKKKHEFCFVWKKIFKKNITSNWKPRDRSIAIGNSIVRLPGAAAKHAWAATGSQPAKSGISSLASSHSGEQSHVNDNSTHLMVPFWQVNQPVGQNYKNTHVHVALCKFFVFK